ncbi:GntR family transcriptional regulator [Saccharopolyspora sp. 5N708]|uniref:GntR family transcriptional regulator n=1 Tax=Saccharopolyspora sp. 5N708 TaxID=3457424 RepID=UPI003FCFD3BD
MTSSRLPTRAADVYGLIRADIFTGKLAPGTRLKFNELCARYDTSVGAAREALTKLVSENLVMVRPRQGYIVSTLSRAEFADLVQARVEVEAIALRLSVEAGDMAWEAAVVSAHHVLERTSFSDSEDRLMPTQAWSDAHRAFHGTLISACPSRRLVAFASQLREESALYQLWSISSRLEPHRDGAGEHRALLDSALKRDAPLAEELIREHLLHTARLVLDLDDDEFRRETGENRSTQP